MAIKTGSERRDEQENPPASVYHPPVSKGFDCKRSHTATSDIFPISFKKLAGLPAGFLLREIQMQPQRRSDAEKSFWREMKEANGAGASEDGLFGEV
jgi:hypothetical protein